MYITNDHIIQGARKYNLSITFNSKEKNIRRRRRRRMRRRKRKRRKQVKLSGIK